MIITSAHESEQHDNPHNLSIRGNCLKLSCGVPRHKIKVVAIPTLFGDPEEDGTVLGTHTTIWDEWMVILSPMGIAPQKATGPTCIWQPSPRERRSYGHH